jgi:hypothetical protein
MKMAQGSRHKAQGKTGFNLKGYRCAAVNGFAVMYYRYAIVVYKLA